MKYTLVGLFFLLVPIAHAYNPVQIQSGQPFDEISIPMDEEEQNRSYLGTLNSYPHLYEFSLEETTTLQIRTRQREVDEAEPTNLILLSVHPDTERITEIVRLNTPIKERTTEFDGLLGISFIESEWLEEDLEPGLYRLEVSTPVNESAYELDFGFDTVSNGYFGTFATIREVQRHFGYSWFQYLVSTYVLYQIGIVLIILGIWYTWRRYKQVSNVT